MKKILLIEDDQFLRTLYLDLLKKIEVQVDFAVDGEEAYKKITEGNWDLILLDVLLPKMNALEILNKLKAEQPDKLKQKIVISTNSVDDTMYTTLKNFGIEILNKSEMNPDQFIKKVTDYLA